MPGARKIVLLCVAALGGVAITPLAAQVDPGSANAESGPTAETTTSTPNTTSNAAETPAAVTPAAKKLPEPGSTTIRMSIDDAVRMAMFNNFDVKIAEVSRTIQQRNLVLEKSAFDPYFTAGVNAGKSRRATTSFLDLGAAALTEIQVNPFETQSYTLSYGARTLLGTQYTITLNQARLDQPESQGSIFGINPQESLSAKIEFTQPLLQGAWHRYNSSRLRVAANNQEISNYQLHQTASELIYRVEVAYWQLSFAIQNYESKLQALETAGINAQNMRDGRQTGARSESDVITAESQLALRKVELNEAEVLLKNSRDQLLVLINQTGNDSLRRRWDSGEKVVPYDRIWVVPTSTPKGEEFFPEREEGMELAFSHRPDFKEIGVQMQNQKVQIEVAWSEALPQLDLTGSWEQLGLDDTFNRAFSSLGTGRYYAWTVGVELRYLLSRRGPRSRYHRAKDEFRQLKYRRSQLENQIVVEVDQSIRNLKSLHQRVKDLADRVRLQGELLNKEQEKLQLGRTVFYNVSVIEDDLLESQALSLRAQAEYQAAKADYYRVTGTLLSRRGVEAGRN